LLVNGLNFRNAQRPAVDANFIDESFEILSVLVSTYLKSSGRGGKSAGDIATGNAKAVLI
jgi:hypothetical protein